MGRKRLVSIILFLLILIPFKVEARDNPYKWYWQYIEGTKVSNCIYIAWDEAKRHTGLELPYWGLAGRTKENSWLFKAEEDGYEIGYVARPNSIAVYEGHVAYVLSVTDDGKKMITNQGGLFNRKENEETGEVIIEPKNGTGTVFNYKVNATVGPKSWSGLELFGFIYLDVVDGFISTTTKAGESIPTSSTSKISDYPQPTRTKSTTTTTTELITTSSVSTSEVTTITSTSTTTQEVINDKKRVDYKIIWVVLAIVIFTLLLVTTCIYKLRKKK